MPESINCPVQDTKFIKFLCDCDLKKRKMFW